MQWRPLSNISKDQAGRVLDIFITDVEDQAEFGVGTEDYVRNILTNAFGSKKPTPFIDPNPHRTRCAGVGYFKMDEFI